MHPKQCLESQGHFNLHPLHCLPGQNIWGINDAAAALILQQIWDHIYGMNIPVKVKPLGPIFSIVGSFVSPSPLT